MNPISSPSASATYRKAAGSARRRDRRGSTSSADAG
jgi:hypothetical protein